MLAWENFLSLKEGELGKAVVGRWLRPLRILDFDACNLYLEAQDSFQANWFEEQIRPKLKQQLKNNNGREIQVYLVVKAEEKDARPKKEKKGKPTYRPELTLSSDSLDPDATLGDFVVTHSNDLLKSFLTEFTASPPKIALGSFNPLFFYGPSGAGKSHLLMGLAHCLKERGLSVFYIRAETFTEHVVRAIRIGAMQEFRKAYRHIDVLIIDDVHLFARKWATQEELFHTFNTLHTAGRQIILSANAPPHLLTEIEPRLISRFEWGILLRTEKLEPAEVKELFQKRMSSYGLPLTEELLSFLFSTFSQPKSISRALHTLLLRSHSKKTSTLDLNLVKSYLAPLIEEEKENVLSPTKIVRAVADFYGMRTDDILGKSQSRDCAMPRQMAMYICRLQLDLPFLKIGSFFERDHSTVMSSIRQIQKKLDEGDGEVCSAKTTILHKLE